MQKVLYVSRYLMFLFQKLFSHQASPRELIITKPYPQFCQPDDTESVELLQSKIDVAEWTEKPFSPYTSCLS